MHTCCRHQIQLHLHPCTHMLYIHWPQSLRAGILGITESCLLVEDTKKILFIFCPSNPIMLSYHPSVLPAGMLYTSLFVSLPVFHSLSTLSIRLSLLYVSKRYPFIFFITFFSPLSDHLPANFFIIPPFFQYFLPPKRSLFILSMYINAKQRAG